MADLELCGDPIFRAVFSSISFACDFQAGCAICNLKASRIHSGIYMASLLDKSRSACLNLGFVVFVEALVCYWYYHFLSHVQVDDVLAIRGLMDSVLPFNGSTTVSSRS